MRKMIIIEFCNYLNFPTGGQLTFAKNLIDIYGEELYLVGISDNQFDEVGVWSTKSISNKAIRFFNLGFKGRRHNPIIPLRLISFLKLRKYRKEIFKENFDLVFIQSPEVLIALRTSIKAKICFRFAGVENPLEYSRFWYGKYLARIHDSFLSKSLKSVDLILASADMKAIEQMKKRLFPGILRTEIIQFPTRINTGIFHPVNRIESRVSLKINLKSIVIVTVGRIAAIKNWKLLIDSFTLIQCEQQDSHLYFIGEGEDLKKAQMYVDEKLLNNNVHFTGRLPANEISKYLNSANLYAMTSIKEGWPTSLVEAAACGIPVCITNFSGSYEIIQHGVNGIVSNNYDMKHFAAMMKEALHLERFVPTEEFINRFSLDTLHENLESIFDENKKQ